MDALDHFFFFGFGAEADARIWRRISGFKDANNFRVGTLESSRFLLTASMGALPMTIIELCTTLSDDDRCRELLELLRTSISISVCDQAIGTAAQL